MCTNYEVTSSRHRLRHFGISLSADWHSPIGKYHVFNHYPAPIVRLDQETLSQPELINAEFGLLPVWAKEPRIKFATMNARSERVASAPAFRHAWSHGQKCIIPADWIVEPDWRSGHYVPARIARADGEPLGIAGLWDRWVDKISGEVIFSFTMLTINASDDPFMRQFHKAGVEKRSVVMLADEDYQEWLMCPAAMNLALLHSTGLHHLVIL